MEAIVVDAILLSHLEVMPPTIHIHGRIASQWKDASVVFSSQEGGVSIDGKPLTFRLKVSQSEIRLLHVLSLLRLQRESQAIKSWVELAP